MADWIDKLTELRRQKEAGVIDDAAFDARRVEIFAERDAERPARPPRPPPTPSPPPLPTPSPPPIVATPSVEPDAGPEQQEAQVAPSRPEPVHDDSFVRPAETWDSSPPSPGEAPAAQPTAEADHAAAPVSTSAMPVTPVLPAPDPVSTEPAASPVPPPQAAQASQIPTFTPPPLAGATAAGPAPVLLAMIALGGVILVAGGIWLAMTLPRESGERAATAPAAAGPMVDARPAPEAPEAAAAAATIAPAPKVSLGPAILSGRVATSVSYDAAQTPSFTAILSARYDGVGPQDQVVASLWKGRAKVANCDGGVPAPLPAGSYRCERNQLPPGAYEFHVGFPGRRMSTYRFNLVSRPPPPPPEHAEVRAPPPPADTITQPDWIRRPTAEDLSRFYPNRAMQGGVEGSTRIACRVNVSGRLVDCVVQSETPPGYGFGAAAIRMSSKMLMRPMMRNGEPIDGAITIPIRWQLH